MKFKTFLLSALFTFSLYPSHAQEESSLPGNLEQQYQEMKQNAETYNEYKVIRESRLDEWFAVIQDSLQNLKLKVINEKKYSTALNDTIASINLKRDELANSVQEYDYGQTHISVIGIDFTKKGFILLTFIIEAILIIILAVLLFKFFDNQRVTTDTVREHERLVSEYEEYKKRALEKQSKLARELQTARNKLDDLRRKR